MLIIVAGRTASGKSTIAKAAAELAGGRHDSFGGFVRERATAEGLDAADRRTLQDLGQSLVEAGPDDFVDQFLTYADYTPGSVLIVDGLRHASVLHALRRSAEKQGDGVRLVYVDVDEQTRLQRLRGRGLDDAAIQSVEVHPSERDVLQRLRGEADLVIDGAGSLAEVAALVRRELAG